MLPTEYNDGLVQDFTIVEQPTRTYRLRFDGFPSTGMATGLEAMQQAVFLALQTERFRYAIYSWNYGVELERLFGEGMTPYLQAQIRRAIEEALAGKRPSYCAPDAKVLCGERVLTTAPYTAYVRIADGCDNRCAYCAIPLIRGGFRSRDMQSVLDEIRALADRGVKEHVLVAQDTSRFGMDTHGRSLLPELMVRAADIPGVEWLRVLYCYPDEVDDALLEAMASRPNICRYLDLPLQHADPQLLRRMNRRGDIEQTRAFLKKAREMGFTLRTTFITGFPGETEEQFERLMEFVRDVRFDRLGAFCYSAEDDTPAAAMAHQVPEDVKQRRLDRLMTAQQAISLERNRLRVGNEERVLVESVGADGLAVARSAAEAPETDGVIRVSGACEADIGCFVTARITGADTYDLTGEKL